MLYFLIAIGATTVGSLTGMGGGVIIKPLMDVLHGFDVQTIGVLSSLTVFSMSVVSIGKQMLARTKIPFGTAIPLALGSVAGGLAGEKLLQVIVDALRANSAVTVVQNVVLSLLILAVFLYMKNKSRIPSRELRGVVVSLLVGVFLGVCSSFLGIGGGPINVALIIYLFSFDTKTATVCSLVTILFAQISKLTTVALTTGFGVFDLSIAPVMIVGAIAGGFIGASLNKKCSEAAVAKAFNAGAGHLHLQYRPQSGRLRLGKERISPRRNPFLFYAVCGKIERGKARCIYAENSKGEAPDLPGGAAGAGHQRHPRQSAVSQGRAGRRPLRPR